MLEFKFAKTRADVDDMKRTRAEQLQERGYAKGYDDNGRKVVLAVLVADDEQRKVIL